jgi:hypothetical protein
MTSQEKSTDTTTVTSSDPPNVTLENTGKTRGPDVPEGVKTRSECPIEAQQEDAPQPGDSSANAAPEPAENGASSQFEHGFPTDLLRDIDPAWRNAAKATVARPSPKWRPTSDVQAKILEAEEARAGEPLDPELVQKAAENLRLWTGVEDDGPLDADEDPLPPKSSAESRTLPLPFEPAWAAAEILMAEEARAAGVKFSEEESPAAGGTFGDVLDAMIAQAPSLPEAYPSAAPLDAAAEAFVAAAVVPDPQAFTSTAELIASARGWCEANDAYPFGRRILARQLARVGGVRHSNGQARGWRGVKLR